MVLPYAIPVQGRLVPARFKCCSPVLSRRASPISGSSIPLLSTGYRIGSNRTTVVSWLISVPDSSCTPRRTVAAQPRPVPGIQWGGGGTTGISYVGTEHGRTNA
eukprot:3940564-Rhodomonas_salina.1